MAKINSSRDNPSALRRWKSLSLRLVPTIKNAYAASTVHVYRGYWKKQPGAAVRLSTLARFLHTGAQRVLEASRGTIPK